MPLENLHLNKMWFVLISYIITLDRLNFQRPIHIPWSTLVAKQNLQVKEFNMIKEQHIILISTF